MTSAADTTDTGTDTPTWSQFVAAMLKAAEALEGAKAVTVLPLTVVPNGDSFKAGINASFAVEVLTTPGDPGSGTKTVTLSGLYEFDTGGPAAYIAFNENGGKTLGPADAIAQPIATLTQSYFSGIQYTATVAPATVTIDAVVGAALTVPANVALVTAITNTKGPGYVGYDGFPIYEGFYGDFGAALLAKSLTAVDKTASPPDMIGVLSQVISGGTQQSFMVVLPPASLVNGSPTGSATGYVLVGPTASLQGLLPDPWQFGMSGKASVEVGPSISVNAYAECLIQTATMDADVAGGDPSHVTYTGIGVCFDTGATTEVHPGTVVALSVDSVSNLKLTAEDMDGDTVILIDRTNGATTGVAPSPSANDPAGYVNTGIEFFMAHAVLFDLAGGDLYVQPYPGVSD